MQLNPLKWLKPQIVINQLPIQKPEAKSVDDYLKHEAIDRIKETIANFAQAVLDCEDPDLSDAIKYEAIYNLYHNIELDDHISAVRDIIFFEISQTPFYFATGNGTKDEKLTELFQTKWFYDLIRIFIETENWGRSLIQIEGEKGNIREIELIDRYHYRPKSEGLSIDKWSEKIDLYWNEKPLSDYLIYIEAQRPLGLYANIAKEFILKREVTQLWGVFNELFTTPYLIVQTNFNDKNHRKNIIDWLTNRRHSGFAVVGTDDVVNSVTNGGAGWQSYEAFKNAANQSISKVFLGGTMVMDDGSSRSQAEVHERNKEAFIESRRVSFRFFMNEIFLDKLGNLGYAIPKDVKFFWDRSEKPNLTQLTAMVSKLAPYYEFDEKELTEKFGFTLTTKKAVQPVNSGNNLKNMYEL